MRENSNQAVKGCRAKSSQPDVEDVQRQKQKNADAGYPVQQSGQLNFTLLGFVFHKIIFHSWKNRVMVEPNQLSTLLFHGYGFLTIGGMRS